MEAALAAIRRLHERVVQLETEVEALKIEKRYLMALFGLPPAPPYPRAHDLGVPTHYWRRPQTLGELMGQQAQQECVQKLAAPAAPSTHSTPLPAKAMR